MVGADKGCVMAYPQRLLTDDEAIVREFHPHWRVLIPAGLWGVIGVAIGIAGAVRFDGAPTYVAAVVGALLVLVLAIPPMVRRRFRLYVLTTERIIVRDGIVARGSTEIPLESINNVLFHQGIVERMLGYGDVLIESAGQDGQSRLADIPDPEAFQSQLYRVREQRSMLLNRGTATAPATSEDPVARLQALADLHERGALTDAEFEQQKARILGDL